MTELQTFINQDFGEIRGLEINNIPYLIGKDVAEKLGYANTANAIKRHVDDDDKLTHRFSDSGQNRDMYIINESGFYALVFGSKLPTAKRFKHWVTSEVLPSIRKHGIYATDSTIDSMLSNPDFGIKLLTKLKQEQEEKKLLQEQLEQQKLLVDFAKTVQGSNENILVRETSKLASNYTGVDIGEKGLYQKLRDWGFVSKKKNEPSRRAYMQNILEYVERPTQVYPFTAFTTMVTPKGQIYIVNRLIKESLERTVA